MCHLMEEEEQEDSKQHMLVQNHPLRETLISNAVLVKGERNKNVFVTHQKYPRDGCKD